MIVTDLRAMKSMMKKINAIGAEEIRWTIGKGEIHGRYVDPAHVAMLDMKLKYNKTDDKVNFYDFKLFDLALDITTLYSRINLLPAGNIKKDNDPENKLKIDVAMNKEKIIGLFFHHPMLDFPETLRDVESISSAKLPSGCLDVDATANINTRQFKLFLKIAEAEIDHITLIAEQEKGKLTASFSNDYDETVSSDLTYSLGGIEGTDLKFLNKDVKTAKTLFSIDYMASIVNLVNAPTIKIGLKTDNPLVIWWKEKDNLEGIYLLAPRIEWSD